MQSPNNTKPAGSVPTTWELRTYDVLGNDKDGYEVNDVYIAGTVELRIPQTRHNSGIDHFLCADNREHSACTDNDGKGRCAKCGALFASYSAEFVSATPTYRQIKRTFGVRCRIETDGDDLNITVNRQRDGYPIGEMRCTSHVSLSPVRKGEAK